MNPFWKDIFREIKNTLGRFLSLLIITALGAASVVGIQAAAFDMRAIADQTFKSHKLYDIQIKSTTGFSDADIAALRRTPGVDEVMPTYVFDAFIHRDGLHAARTYALPDGLNRIDVVQGRLPRKPSECAVERQLFQDGRFRLGDTIVLGLDDDEDYDAVLYSETFTIVGVVSSPLYISHERGNTTLGDGTLAYYLYLHPQAYVLDVYTDAFVRMRGSQRIDNLSEGYYDVADGWKKTIEALGDERLAQHIADRADTRTNLNDAWIDYDDARTELDKSTAAGRRELDDVEGALYDTAGDLKKGQSSLTEEIVARQRDLDQKKREITANRIELDAQRTALKNAQNEINAAKTSLQGQLSALQGMAPRGASPQIDASYRQIDDGLRTLDAQQAEIDVARVTLAQALVDLERADQQIESAQRAIDDARRKSQADLDGGWESYIQGWNAYRQGVDSLHASEVDALDTLDDTKEDLDEAQEDLDDAADPEWFVDTREDGLAFDSYYQDTLRLQKIGYVFPMVFYLVAILVSLTSMSRMVEEHRTQIGIYKALGYRPAAIMAKYLVYAFGASFSGGMLGVFVGSWLFPRVISEAYGFLYHMPPVETPVPIDTSAIAIAMAVLSVVSVTIVTCAGSMVGEPSLLMRPKSPPVGKRVLFERIGFIWNNLGFIGKVTARNIFRYKKRFFMTVVGIAGCTALLLTAFGLSDSVSSVSTLQYGTIVKYDARAYLKEIETSSRRASIEAQLSGEHLFIREESVDTAGVENGFSASLVVPETPEALGRYIALKPPKSDAALTLAPGSVFLTEKLARTMGVGIGDRFTMTDSDGKSYESRVTGIVENYVMHFIYMAPDVYEDLFGEAPLPNGLLALTDDPVSFANRLLKHDDVRAVINTDDILNNLSDSTNALGIVTIVLLVLACALAFVVLFNLTNINISERIRELATIKVLGFYDSELAMYVYRENGAVTAMGIAVGLVAGIFLDRFVLSSAEIDLFKFPRVIEPLSYAYAVALSALFAVFVNLVMNVRLAKIDMVESLKNVE